MTDLKNIAIFFGNELFLDKTDSQETDILNKEKHSTTVSSHPIRAEQRKNLITQSNTEQHVRTTKSNPNS